MEQAGQSGNRRWMIALTLFATLTLGIETFHFIEHVAQVVQKFMLDFDFPRGLIGQFDLEPIHFVFNASYLAALIVIAALWWKCGRSYSYTFGWTMAVIMSGVIVEGYHVFEHTLRFIAYLKDGMQGQNGFIGQHFDVVIAHFILNVLVYIPILWMYFFEGLHEELMSLLPPVLARKWAAEPAQDVQQ